MNGARELKIATLLVESRIDIQARFDYWNRVVFDGRLPAVPVKWGRSKRWGGLARGTLDRMNRTGVVNSIEISDFIVDDERIIDGIMLHEMIHAEMYLQGKEGHGPDFQRLRRQYSAKAGFEIPVTEDIANFTVPEDMAGKPKGVVVQQAGSKQGLVVYNYNFFNKSLGALKEYYEMMADRYRQKGVQMKTTFLISEVRDLWKYPEKRSLMHGYYEVPDSLISDVLNQSRSIAQVVT